MKPVILLTTNVDGITNTLNELYIKTVIAAGGTPIMLPNTADISAIEGAAAIADGFLFTGGADVDPACYGEEPSEKLGDITPLRDSTELALFKIAYDSGKPIFGICRGMQLINVALGGSLYQDIEENNPNALQHRHDPALPLGAMQHTVTLVEGTPLSRLYGKEVFGVNSFHHQAVKQLAPSLRPMAYADDDILEAFYMPERRYLSAVQWHPERMYFENEDTRLMFAEFIRAAGGV